MSRPPHAQEDNTMSKHTFTMEVEDGIEIEASVEYPWFDPREEPPADPVYAFVAGHVTDDGASWRQVTLEELLDEAKIVDEEALWARVDEQLTDEMVDYCDRRAEGY